LSARVDCPACGHTAILVSDARAADRYVCLEPTCGVVSAVAYRDPDGTPHLLPGVPAVEAPLAPHRPLPAYSDYVASAAVLSLTVIADDGKPVGPADVARVMQVIWSDLRAGAREGACPVDALEAHTGAMRSYRARWVCLAAR
jgi:hypothetical protein